jgi:spore germination cell wall hydrolase CwlJ-like protein
MAPVKTIFILMLLVGSVFYISPTKTMGEYRKLDSIEREVDKIRVEAVKKRIKEKNTEELISLVRMSNVSDETENEITRVKSELNKLKIRIKKETCRVPLSNENLRWLSLNIYHEARGEGLKGKMAVAMVTLNRSNHPRFPSTVKKVVQQRYQFSWYNDRKVHKPTDEKLWKISQEVAKLTIDLYNNASEVMEEDPITKGSQFYYASSGPNKVRKPYWVRGENLKHVAKIGSHSFFKI